MSQHYTNPKRADDPHALPNIEVFYDDPAGTNGFHADDFENCSQCAATPVRLFHSIPSNRSLCAKCHAEENPAGWYWQACFPGCLPDGDPTGPFASEAEALADAREGMDDAS